MLGQPASAFSIVDAYMLAHEHEPQFRSAVAERDVNLATARQTIAAYLPQVSYSMTNIPTEDRTRHVISVNQPLLSLDRLATVKQRTPRRNFARATFSVREQELAQRTLKAVTDIVRASESGRLNGAKIAALKEQSDRARHLYEKGQGTVTDARDIEVRYEQAQANQILLESEQQAALDRFEALTGTRPAADELKLPDELKSVILEPRDTYQQRIAEANPQISAARSSERVSELETQRVRGTLLPTVGGAASFSRSKGNNLNYVGIAINAPLNAGSLFQVGSASAAARRSAEERRQTEERIRVDFLRYYRLVDGGQRSLTINRKAVLSAELSVIANQRSYEGGVRTNVDVVNSIQALFEVKSQYVTSATTVSENLLAMLLLAATPPEEALAITQRFLLGQ